MKTNQAPKTETLAPLTLTCQMEIEAADVSDGKAPLPRFRILAYTGGPMRVAGWRYPVIVDLSGMCIPSQNRPIRMGHDATHGVGHTDEIKVQGTQLIAAGVVSRDTPAAKEIVASSRNGFPWQASIGASVEDAEFIKENQKTVVNGQEVTGPVNVIRKSVLGEISFVDLGADGRTSASVAATAQEGDANVEMKDNKEPVPVAETVQLEIAARIRTEAAVETARIAAVRKICNGQYSEIEAQAIREGWDATRCELEVLRASRPKAPAMITAHENSVTPLVLEAACAISAKLAGCEQSYDERTLDVVGKRFRGGIGMQELLLEAAWHNGYTGRNFRDSRAVLRHAFAQDVQAGFSSIDVGGILSNVANKFLLDGFYSVEGVWRSICAVRNVSDFKTVTSYRLVGRDQYEQVTPGGELKHGSLGEEKYSNKADTYGLLLSIDRRDIINDDLGAITAIPRKLGRGSGLKINDVFWTTFLNNGAFFTVANRNLLTGVDTALGIDGLTKAEVAFLDQVDTDGKPIGVMPSILLVPTALSALGTQLYKSLEIRDTTPSSKFPVANPHQGKFRIEVSRYGPLFRCNAGRVRPCSCGGDK